MKFLFLKKHKHIFFLLLILSFVLLRFVSLDADRPLPVFAHVNDEYYKSSGAIYNAEFDEWITEDTNSGLLYSPLFNLFQFVTLDIFDVSLWSLRLLSCFFGILGIIFLYLLLSRQDKNLALFASSLLSLQFIYFILNRVALPENMLITLTLCGFWILTYIDNNTTSASKIKNLLLSVLSGLIFGFSFLFKVSQLYILPIICLFLLFQLIHRDMNLKQILIVFLTYFLFPLWYFISYIPSIYNHVAAQIAFTNISNLPYLFVFRPFVMFVNYFLAFPSVFLLLLLFLLYIKFESIKINDLGFTKWIMNISLSEKVAYSWLFGTLFGIIFTSLVDRRWCFIIIPLVIFPAILIKKYTSLNRDKKELLNKELINLDFIKRFSISNYLLESVQRNKRFIIRSFLIIVLFVLFEGVLANYFILSHNKMFSILQRLFVFDVAPNLMEVILNLFSNFAFQLVFSVFLVGLIIFVFLLYYLFKKETFEQKFTHILIFLLISQLILGFFIYGNKLFFSKFVEINSYSIAIISFVFSLFLFLLFSKNSKMFFNITVFSYVIYCLISIIMVLSFPQFSVLEASSVIEEYTQEGDYIAGYFAHGLSIESGTKPLIYTLLPIYQDYISYSAVDKYKPVLFLTPPSGSTLRVPNLEDIGYEVEYLDTLNIGSVFGFGPSRSEVEVYKIIYLNESVNNIES